MKTLVSAGWVLLVLEVLVVMFLFVSKNMGDDAAGRGMARGFALLLAPVVLVAGALLAWGARGGPKAVLWISLLLVFSPVLYAALSMAGSTMSSLDHRLGRAQFGRFDDASLTTLARAISRADTTAVRATLAASPPDFRARDQRERTMLGHAISEAIDDYSGTGRVEFVRLLLAAGAPVTLSEIAPSRQPSSVSAHNLVYHLYGVHNAAALEILDLVLTAGLSPDQVDEDSVPIYFSSYTVLPALEVLAKHGADFTRLDPRTDRLHQNALMSAVSSRNWDLATFFLAQGLSPDYTAPDGRSARSILAEVDPPGSVYYGDDEKHHVAFLEALSRVPRRP